MPITYDNVIDQVIIGPNCFVYDYPDTLVDSLPREISISGSINVEVGIDGFVTDAEIEISGLVTNEVIEIHGSI